MMRGAACSRLVQAGLLAPRSVPAFCDTVRTSSTWKAIRACGNRVMRLTRTSRVVLFVPDDLRGRPSEVEAQSVADVAGQQRRGNLLTTPSTASTSLARAGECRSASRGGMAGVEGGHQNAALANDRISVHRDPQPGQEPLQQ
jgi:hypothetical protein